MTAKESDNPVMRAVSALRSMLRDVTRVDAKQITYVTALRILAGDLDCTLQALSAVVNSAHNSARSACGSAGTGRTGERRAG